MKRSINKQNPNTVIPEVRSAFRNPIYRKYRTPMGFRNTALSGRVRNDNSFVWVGAV